jgi:hypothetical protein
MTLLLNRFYGIVYRTTTGTTVVFNARVIARTANTVIIKFMNSRGIIVNRILRIARIIRAVLL